MYRILHISVPPESTIIFRGDTGLRKDPRSSIKKFLIPLYTLIDSSKKGVQHSVKQLTKKTVFSSIATQTTNTMEDNNGGAIAPPAGLAVASPKRERLYIPLGVKIDLCIQAERVVRAEKKESLKAFCRRHEIQPSQLRRWSKNLMKMKQTVDETKRKATRVACTSGRPSRLEKIQHKLCPWFDSVRAEGGKVSVRQASIKAKRHDRSLHRLKRYTLFAIVRRFMKAKGVVDRAITHKAQDDPKKKEDAATSFLLSTRNLLEQPNRSKAFIINMDQTPYDPKDSEKRTLAKKGSKTVHGKNAKTSIGRISALLAVCADGTKLPPLLVYKGKPGGSVEREFKGFPKGMKYIVQDNAWTDERVMLYWVDNILRPYVQTAPTGIIPYLLLDKYKCHYQGSVANAIEDIGVEWDILPGGCTGLIQPIDVGINKPWKARLRHYLEDWLLYQDYSRKTPKEMRSLMASFAIKSWERVTEDYVWNAWRHHPFSYFPDEETRETAFEDDDDDLSYSSSEAGSEEEEEDDEEEEDEEEDVTAV